MWPRRRTSSQTELASERGYLELVGRQPDLPLRDAFFTWRSRWLLMEETQYRMNRLRDDMDYYLVTTPAAELRQGKLDRFYAEQQDLWADVSRRWVEFRKHDRAPQPEVRPS